MKPLFGIHSAWMRSHGLKYLTSLCQVQGIGLEKMLIMAPPGKASNNNILQNY